MNIFFNFSLKRKEKENKLKKKKENGFLVMNNLRASIEIRISLVTKTKLFV